MGKDRQLGFVVDGVVGCEVEEEGCKVCGGIWLAHVNEFSE